MAVARAIAQPVCAEAASRAVRDSERCRISTLRRDFVTSVTVAIHWIAHHGLPESTGPLGLRTNRALEEGCSMRTIVTGILVGAALLLAGPAFAEAQGKGQEKAAEQAQEAVNKQTPAAVKAAPPAVAEQAEKAKKGEKAAKATSKHAVEAVEQVAE
ncbi:MAG: hypothetical protein OEY15_00880 [Myxococcales bacterium]|nr:hypothetical protein [Myxococcales bacterium]